MVQVAEDRDGQRIDNFLAGQLKGVPKSLIYRILRTGQVRINGKRAKADTRVAAGDHVRIPPVRVGEPHDNGAPPKTQIEQVERAIIFEDRDFLVLDKPSGVASHGGSGVTFGAIELLRAARPGDTLELAHRLDRDTSGVLVLARRRPALTGLQALIRDNATTKQYLALLKGHTHKAKFDVKASLRKSILQGGERMVRVTDDGKPSLTRFHIIDIFADASLAEVTLFTGRTHQIRVHAQHIEHPLAGDEKYGERGFNQNMRGAGLKRLFLHAARFEFELDGKSHSFSAPLSPDLAAVLDALPRGVSRKGKLR
jgi:23S rRNA pseudouridine955/2504/2580 synthase